MTKEVEGYLNNFQFAVENCTASGKDIIELLKSKELLKQYIEKQDAEIARLTPVEQPNP